MSPVTPSLLVGVVTETNLLLPFHNPLSAAAIALLTNAVVAIRVELSSVAGVVDSGTPVRVGLAMFAFDDSSDTRLLC